MNVGAVLLLLGAAGAGVAVVASSKPPRRAVPDDVENPPRGRVWSESTTTIATVNAPGWYRDVLTQEGHLCGTSSSGGLGDLDELRAAAEDIGFDKWRCRERNGEATPKPMSFRVDFGKLPTPRVVAVDVRIVDTEAIVERTRVRTQKTTSGRRRGILDVNEYELEGPARETVYCERLARRIAGASLGPYLTRRKLPCSDLPPTPAQQYTLYRAQRETSLNGLTARTWEWFAKVRGGAHAYAARSSIGAGGSYRGLYDLRIDVDGAGVYLAGSIAPSVAPQRLRIEATWRTRLP